MRYNAHIYNGKRTRLETVIPLDTPFTLLVETSRLCNFRCRFCPQSNENTFSKFNRNYLSKYDFELILNQMAEFPSRFKKVYMHGTGEALMNPELPDMIRLLKECGVTDSIDLTSNAALLTPKLGIKLTEAGLNHLHISVEALSSDGYLDIAGKKIDFDRFVDNIRFFSEKRGNCRLTIKIASASVRSESEKKRFFSVFGPLSDEIFIENIHPIWPKFDLPDTLKSDLDATGQYGQEIKEKRICPQIFTVLAVKCDGTVSPCSVDWDNDRALGNIHERTLLQMWNGSKLRELRLGHLENGRNLFTGCSSCGLPKYSCRDDLEPYASELAEKIRREC